MGERVVKVRLSAQISEYEAGMLKAAQATRTVGSEAEKLAAKREAFSQIGTGALAAGTAITALSVMSVKAAISWQSAWAGVTKTVDGTPEQLAEVEQGLRGLTGVLPAAHEEIAAVAEAAGQLGIATPNVVSFTKTMIDLGESTNLSADEAATSLARFVNIMGTSQSKVSNLGSALVGLGNNYATTEREIMEMAMRLAGAGKQINLTEGQVLGLSTALSSVGIEAEAGGSAMSKVMIDMASAVDQGGERLTKFADAAGMSADAFAKKWKSNPAQALAAFVTGLSNAEKQGKSTIGVLADLGITEVRMRDALLRSSSAADLFAGAMRQGNEEFDKNTALAEEAAKRYETVESKLKIAGNAIKDAAISFGSVLLPAVAKGADAVKDLAQWFAQLPEPVQGIIMAATSAGGAIIALGGAALLAVPKVAAFKVALRDLDLIGEKASGRLGRLTKVVGGFVGGVALAKAGSDALVGWIDNIGASAEMTANKLATAKSGVELLSAAMSRGFGADDSIEHAKLALSGLAEMLDRVKAGQNLMESGSSNGKALILANAAVDKLNKQLPELARTNLPLAQQQFRMFTSEANLTDEQILTLIDRMDGYKPVLIDAAREAGVAADSQGLLNTALGDAEDAAASAAGGLDEMQKAADEAEQALTGTAQALADVAGTALSMGDAHDRALSSINALKEAAKGEKVAIDGTNDSSIKFRGSLRDVEQAHRASAEAIIKNGGTIADATAEWNRGRDAVIGMLKAKGMDTAQAQAWADAQLGSASAVKSSIDGVYRAWLNLPENRETKYKVEKAQADAALDELKRKLAGIPNVKRIRLEGYTVGKIDVSIPGSENATGGFYGRGGVKAFAAGGFEPGIYPYKPGGIHKFAEAGYPEAYISGDPQYRSRSEAVWLRTGRELGFTAQAPAPVSAPLSLDGVSITGLLEIGGDGLAQIVDGRISAYDDQRARTGRRGVRL